MRDQGASVLLFIENVKNLLMVSCFLIRVPTSTGKPGKPGKSKKKSSMHGKIMEFENN